MYSSNDRLELFYLPCSTVTDKMIVIEIPMIFSLLFFDYRKEKFVRGENHVLLLIQTETIEFSRIFSRPSLRREPCAVYFFWSTCFSLILMRIIQPVRIFGVSFNMEQDN